MGRNAYRKYGKRALDVILALLLLAVLWPLIAVAAVAVRAKLGAPVVFSQVRTGKYEKPFVMKKLVEQNFIQQSSLNFSTLHQHIPSHASQRLTLPVLFPLP